MTNEKATSRVRLRREGRVARIVVGTGERRNALTGADWHELRVIFDAMADDGDLAVAVVRGSGATFSSGADIAEWQRASQAEVDETFTLMESAFEAIERAPVPVIAVIEGVAAGAGCELALSCDIQLASASARIGMPIARLGILLSPLFAARMIALVGPSRTLELIYSGRLVSAPEAARIGMITRAVGDERLDVEVEDLARSVVDLPTAATRAAKESVGALLAPLREHASHAGRQSAINYPDFTRGVEAFLHHNL
ncbi:MAG: enoyl-CoA hydratase/isomerase family protein [Nocardioidaceae bacterium]